MSILGAILGALYAVNFGLYPPLWGAVIGFLLVAAYRLDAKFRKTEERFTSEIYQLRTRMRDLELTVKNGGSQSLSPETPVKSSVPLPISVSPPASDKPQSTPMARPPSESEKMGIQKTVSQPWPEENLLKDPEPEKTWKPKLWQETSSSTEHAPFSVESCVNWVIHYFSTGNTIAKVGVVLLFFGVAFLLKYVSDQGLFPIEIRLLSTACGAVVLLGLGWKLREKRGPFGLLLQGGGMGIFYLTVFASFRLYQLLPASLAFVLLLVAVILSSCLAVLQDSRALAAFSVSGGFLAPVLASTGKGSHVMLFSYYAILNLGILGMSWFRSWRDLNLVGFAFTFVISVLWGYQFYRPDFFSSTEPFLIFFFLLYFTVTLLFAGRKRSPEALMMDGTLVFGVPIAAFAIQRGLVNDTVYGLAWSAVAFGGFYLTAARMVFRRWGEGLRLLVEAFFAIGVCFLTLAVPLALDGKWTAAIWALEGAAIVWSGLRQNRLLSRCFGMALQVIAGLAFLLAENRPSALFPVFNAFFMGTTLLFISHLFVSFCLQKAEAYEVRSWEKQLAPLFMVFGLLWWVAGGLIELNQAAPTWYRFITETPWIQGGITYSVLIHSYVLFFSLSCALCYALSNRLEWGMLGAVRIGLMPLLALLTLFLLPTGTHAFANIGSLAWIIAFLVHYRLLHLSEKARFPEAFSGLQHFGAFWLLTFLMSWEMYWFADHFIEKASIWASVGLAIIPAAFALAVIRSKESSPWPLGPNRTRYLGMGVLPLLVWVGVWLAFLNFTHAGDPRFVPYIPVVNPIDLVQLFVLMVLGNWYMEARSSKLSLLPSTVDFSIAIGVSSFIWLTAALIRTLHYWAGLPWDFIALFSSSLVQAALSIFWSAVSLSLMILATRKKWRALWLAGASLLGIVVAKLFLIDLSGRGTLERVISFIGTGVLLLLIGYLAPIPPEEKRQAAEVK